MGTLCFHSKALSFSGSQLSLFFFFLTANGNFDVGILMDGMGGIKAKTGNRITTKSKMLLEI